MLLKGYPCHLFDQGIESEAGVDGLQGFEAGRILLFVINNVLPAWQCYGDGMGAEGHWTAEISRLPAGIA
jgi:hypothetical protein